MLPALRVLLRVLLLRVLLLRVLRMGDTHVGHPTLLTGGAECVIRRRTPVCYRTDGSRGAQHLLVRHEMRPVVVPVVVCQAACIRVLEVGRPAAIGSDAERNRNDGGGGAGRVRERWLRTRHAKVLHRARVAVADRVAGPAGQQLPDDGAPLVAVLRDTYLQLLVVFRGPRQLGRPIARRRLRRRRLQPRIPIAH